MALVKEEELIVVVEDVNLQEIEIKEGSEYNNRIYRI
jgi:hypothetical protein